MGVVRLQYVWMTGKRPDGRGEEEEEEEEVGLAQRAEISKLEIVASGSLFSIETKSVFQLKQKVCNWEVMCCNRNTG